MPLYLPASTRGPVWDPADNSWITASMQPEIAVNTQLLGTAGTLIGCRVYVPRTVTVTNVLFQVATAGGTLTAGNCKAAVYSAGVLKGTSVDQSTNWASTGAKYAALVSTFVATPGYYDITWWWNGTTAPTFVRLSTFTTISNAGASAALAGSLIRGYTTSDTALVATAPATLGTKTAAVVYFAALT